MSWFGTVPVQYDEQQFILQVLYVLVCIAFGITGAMISYLQRGKFFLQKSKV